MKSSSPFLCTRKCTRQSTPTHAHAHPDCTHPIHYVVLLRFPINKYERPFKDSWENSICALSSLTLYSCSYPSAKSVCNGCHRTECILEKKKKKSSNRVKTCGHWARGHLLINAIMHMKHVTKPGTIKGPPTSFNWKVWQQASHWTRPHTQCRRNYISKAKWV